MHEVLVNRLGGLSLPRKSVVRLTDRPDMTLDVYRGRKTTMQQLHAHLEQIKLLAVFHVANFLHMSQLRVPVQELRINSSKPYRKFKSPLISSVIVNSGANKLFRMCKSISSKGSREPNVVKIKKHYIFFFLLDFHVLVSFKYNIFVCPFGPQNW